MAKKLKNELVKGNRSQAESIIIDLLRFHFKKLKVVPNDRSVLGRQEIDIYLPEYKFAIEVDGLTHQKPIYGEATFERMKEADARKSKKLKELGIQLYRVTLPEKSSEYYSFLKSEVPNNLVVCIQEWLSKGINSEGNLSESSSTESSGGEIQ
jgi:very-short-patch-repair endonuclease